MSGWDAEKFIKDYFDNTVSVHIRTEQGVEIEVMTLMEFLERDAGGTFILVEPPDGAGVVVHNGMAIQVPSVLLQELRAVYLLKFS